MLTYTLKSKPIDRTIKRQPSRKSLNVFKLFGIALVFVVGIYGVLYATGVPAVRSTVSELVGSTPISKFFYRTYKLSFDDSIPTTMQNSIKEKLGIINYKGKKRFEFTNDKPDLTIAYSFGSKAGDKAEILNTSYLVPVGHFYWLTDGIKSSDIPAKGVIASTEDKDLISKILKEKFNKDITVTASSKPYNDLLKKDCTSIGLIDASKLQPQYKLLTLDGSYFLDSMPNGGIPYSMIIKSADTTDKYITSLITGKLKDILPVTFSKDTILKLNIGGTIAISRRSGAMTVSSGDGGYPAQRIKDFLKNADLVLVNNEVSFVPGCNPASNGMRFCEPTMAIKTLKDIGANIIQLTGNHNNDYGAKYNTSSIATYKSLGWDYFGGGLNTTDAAKILYKDMKGTKLAFVGYNWYDTRYGRPGVGALAGTDRAGANSWASGKLKNDIKAARANGADIVIVSVQYQECWAYVTPVSTQCYSPRGVGGQLEYFRSIMAAGADFVVQPNDPQPMTYELYQGKPIFFSLGNLFFDQTQWLGTRQELILTNYFYDGRLLGTKITTAMYDADLRPYVTTGAKRTQLLTSLKNARP